MSGCRGYRQYSGRRSKGKAVLSVILVLIIIASIAVMILQKHVVYDGSGTPRWELPQKEQQAEAAKSAEEVKITIQSPPEAKKEFLKLFVVEEAPLTLEGWQLARTAAKELGDYKGAVIPVKTVDGIVCFDAKLPMPGARQIRQDTISALTEVLQGETAVEHAVAQLTCFRDHYASGHDVRGMGMLTKSGYLFQDGDNVWWTDPGKEAVRQYLCSLAEQLAAMGFDEILLTDVGYPTTGAVEKLKCDESERPQNIIAFLSEMERTLASYDVVLSVQLPETVILEGSDSVSGLLREDIIQRVERVYAVTTEEMAPDLAAVLAEKDVDFVPVLPVGHSFEGNYVTLPQ